MDDATQPRELPRAPIGTERTRQPGGSGATVYFDLASPQTYFVVERAERMFAALDWQPASSVALAGAPLDAGERDAMARRAERLGLPLLWPPDPAVAVTRAMRVAALAARRGRGREFVLAASRLMFCGSYRIEDRRILQAAADAAGIDAVDVRAAAADPSHDAEIAEHAERLRAAGATQLPVVEVAGVLFCGERRLADAADAARPPRRNWTPAACPGLAAIPAPVSDSEHASGIATERA